MDVFGLTWDNLKSPDVAENFFNRRGPRGNRGKLTKERNGVDGKYEGHGKRRVDQDIIDKWEKEAVEKM